MVTHPRLRRFIIGLGLLLLVTGACFVIANRLIPTWESTLAEQTQTLPGDDIFSAPVLKWEHAITINASPEQVWPWLIQMGDTRGGYYSYRYIEKGITAMAGVDVACYYPNTNTIHPEWQSPAVGQEMLMDILVLRDYQANAYLVAGPKPGQEQAGLLWAWELSPQPDGRTRLLVHMRIQMPGMGGNRLVGAALNLATFMMERKMMEGIKLRAEGGVEADWFQLAEAILWFVILAIGLIAASRFITRNDWRLPLGIGLAAVLALFALVYLQPPLWLRLVLVIALIACILVDSRLQPVLNEARAKISGTSMIS